MKQPGEQHTISFSSPINRIIPGLGLPLVLLLAAALRFSRLGQFDNQYYTATVASMLTSWHNFLFASFDPGGVVSVDKPPVAFWLDSVPGALLGVSGFSVTLLHALAGIASVALLYALLRPAYGKTTALLAALALAVIPVAVAMDSRNEPDSIVSLELLLAAFCVVRATRSHPLRWLMAAAFIIGVGFNTKMGVALVPVPALLLYYALATSGRWRLRLAHLGLALGLMTVVSLAWVGLVAATPPDRRPYVGSTPDNSIWTLVVEYNGLRRFTSFIGPRPSPGTPLPPPGQSSPPGLPAQAPPLSPPGLPSPTSALELFTPPLANQLGGLLLLAAMGLVVASVRLLLPDIYRHPRSWPGLLQRPATGQLVLWGGWLVAGILVFGLAPSTRTHPYYLSQLAAPCAAVLAIGLNEAGHRFRRRARLGWALPVIIAVAGAYQLYLFRTALSGWVQAGVIVGLGATVGILALAFPHRATHTPLAKGVAIAGCLILLAIPLAMSTAQGATSVGVRPPAVPGYGQPIGGPPPAPSPPGTGERQRVEAVARFIAARGDAGSLFAVGTMRASEAAPFIIRGIPAVAIGGFSGNDPIFTPESLAATARAGKLGYFLMPGGESEPRPNPQRAILDSIRRTWQDISIPTGLPRGTFYRYPGP